MKYTRGLDASNAVGRNGFYKKNVSMDTFQLGTCVWRGHEFVTAGSAQTPLFSPEFPDGYSTTFKNRSWTGMTVDYSWKNGGLSMELRSTLPGPLLTSAQSVLRLRWAFRNAPGSVESLDKKFTSRVGTDISFKGSRILLCGNRQRPTLIVASAPIKSINAISWEHWTISFAKEKGSVLIVPLLNIADAPRTSVLQKLWLSLVERPPVACEERYAVHDNQLMLEQRFPGAVLAPIPQLWALKGIDKKLLKLPPSTTLAQTLIGPYAVVTTPLARFEISLDWVSARAVSSRSVNGPLQPIPEELAYAGDVSWDPKTPMDRLLSLRVWAPLISCMPDNLRKKILPELMPPSPDAFRKSLETIVEPVTKGVWAKEAKLFDEWGDVSYDSDWYNGLTLSGMAAAAECSDSSIARQGTALARESAGERKKLTAYYEIIHDWLLGTSWTDPRGETWNIDCSHNGLEGILAEARMCEAEGNMIRKDRMLYLAGKIAVSLMSCYPLVDWCRKNGFILRDNGGMHIGISQLSEGNGIGIDTLTTKAPYSLAGHFPASCSLIRMYGPLDRWRKAADLWKEKVPERYKDWALYYTGKKMPKGAVAKKTLRQELRAQAAVFYSLAPDICMRLWVLRQDPDKVEGLFKAPLNLAEQLLCRSGSTMVSG